MLASRLETNMGNDKHAQRLQMAMEELQGATSEDGQALKAALSWALDELRLFEDLAQGRDVFEDAMNEIRRRNKWLHGKLQERDAETELLRSPYADIVEQYTSIRHLLGRVQQELPTALRRVPIQEAVARLVAEYHDVDGTRRNLAGVDVLDDPRMDGQRWLFCHQVAPAMLDAWPVWEESTKNGTTRCRTIWKRTDVLTEPLGYLVGTSLWRPLRLPGMDRDGVVRTRDMTETHFQRIDGWQPWVGDGWMSAGIDWTWPDVDPKNIGECWRPACFAAEKEDKQ
jgi:hypothetical protein